MAEYDAGTSVGKYLLDADLALKTQQQLIKGYQDLAQAANVKPPVLPAPSAAGGGSSASSIAQTQRAQASLEQQQARLARSQGDTARATDLETAAFQRLTAQLVRTDITEVESIAIQKQLNSLQTQTARATQQGSGIVQQFGSAAKSSLIGILGPAALVGVAVKGIGSAIEGAGEALQLRETKNSLKAVAGDTQTYATIVKSARDQQLLFGGSLQENIEGLTGLAVTSRNTGANLTQLIDLQKRLTVLNPAQGATGGLIALNEALAGNVSSLSRRFNIPKAALAELSDATKPAAERLAVLSDFLDKVGISSKAVAGRVDEDAAAFRRLNAELGDTKLNAGSELATAFSGAATGLARIIGLINGNPQAIAELKAITGRGQSDTGNTHVVDQSAIDAEARDIAARRANLQLGSQSPFLRTASRVPFQTPTAAVGVAPDDTEKIRRAREQLTQLNLAGEDATASGDRLTQSYHAGALNLDQYLRALESTVQRTRENVDIEDFRARTQLRSVAVTQQLNTELADQAVKTLEAKVKAQEFGDVESNLAKIGADVRAGLVTSGDGAAILAARLQLPIDKARELIGLQLQLAGLVSNQARSQLSDVGKKDFDTFGTPTALEKQQADAFTKASNDASTARAESNKRLADSQDALALASAKNDKARLAILQKQADQLKIQADATSDIAQKNTLLAERNGVLGQIASLQNSAAKTQTSELNKQLNLTESIRDSEEKRFKAQLDAAAAAIKDRQDRRKEDQEIAAAQRILNDPRKARLAGAAQDKIDLITIERQQRALDIADKQATAGGTIINGKLFQSVPGSGGAVPVGGAPPGPVPIPTGPQTPTGASAASAQLVRLQLTDQGGRVIAETVEPIILANLQVGFTRSRSAGGGKST